MRYKSSAEAASSFLSRAPRRLGRAYKRPRDTPAPRTKRKPGERVTMNLARATLEEILDCVSARINDAHARGVEPAHITNVAWSMLNDALHLTGPT